MMKLIFTILSLSSIAAKATNYYVSNAGSDAKNGTSSGTSWQTISKVNGFSFSSGDSILFKCGDTWNEKLIVPNSNIIFSSYGNGVKPLITGFQVQTGFTQSGNIWTATATTMKTLNTVMINGLYGWKARYPNSSNMVFKKSVSTTKQNTYLTGDTNYVGAEIVSRPIQWVLNISKVTYQNVDSLTFSPPLKYGPVGQWDYFFQNRADLIDTLGEWSFDSSNYSLSVYSVASPSVQISTIDTLVLVNHKNNVSFNNISFTGANTYTVKIDTSNSFTFKNCSINYAGNFGLHASKCQDLLIDNDSIQNCYNGGALIGVELVGLGGITVDTCKRARITNNYISKSGIRAGMASALTEHPVDGEINHFGIWIAGDSSYIYHNTIDSSGYCALRWAGRNDSIFYNYITNFCFVKPDGGGTYTYLGSGQNIMNDSGTVIYNNIISNGLGVSNPQGNIALNNITGGIYFDNYAHYVTVSNNTVFNCRFACLYLIQSSNITFIGNNVDDSIGACFRPYAFDSNLTCANNVYYQRSLSNFTLYADNGIVQGFVSDSNYFISLVRTSNQIRYGPFYTFPAYVSATGLDTHSKEAPTGRISDVGTLLYNPTLSDSTIYLNPSYRDARWRYYLQNKVTLRPFTSVILFKINPIWASEYLYITH